MSHKSEVENNPDSESFRVFSKNNIKKNKFPIIITIFFFLTLCFVSLTYHTVWHESDGIVFLNVGQQILDGNGENATTTDAQPGGSVFYAFLNTFIQDGFFTTKIISLLSGSGIVFLTYFIIRNFCDNKVALAAQLLTAVLASLTTLSILAFNELLMLFLITCSMYFITKNQLRHLDILFVGVALGLAFMIRFQPIIILGAFIIFLLIRNKKLHSNILSVVFLIAIFLIVSSPVLAYNSLTYGNALNANTAHYMIGAAVYTNPEWKDGLTKIHLEHGSMYDVFLLDPDLFLKNYFHTLLNRVPDVLFNFNSWPSLSIIPIFQYIGIIPVIGGLLYLQKIKINKTTIGLLFVVTTFTIFLVFLFGEFHTHFFAIIAVPLLAISILNLKHFKKNFWPLLLVLIIFPIVLSIVPFQRTYQLLPMWIPLIVFNVVFFLETIPKIYEKFSSYKKNNISKSAQRVTKMIIILLIVINLGVSARSIDFWIFEQEKEENQADLLNQLMNIIKRGELTEVGYEQKLIGNILAKQAGIEDSLVMSSSHTITYYANSNHLYATFNEGVKNDPLEKYFTRENWSLKDLDESNLFSNPSNINKMKNTMPDYVVYYPFPKINPDDPNIYEKTQAADLWILNDPKNPNIPSNFEVIYKSDKSQFIVYKINN